MTEWETRRMLWAWITNMESELRPFVEEAEAEAKLAEAARVHNVAIHFYEAKLAAALDEAVRWNTVADGYHQRIAALEADLSTTKAELAGWKAAARELERQIKETKQ